MKKYDEQEIRDDYRRLTQTLIEKNLTVTTMESATAGQIVSLITDTEGASKVVKGAFVTYSNEAKIRQGVSEDIINTYSVYSKETAREMARSCQKAYAADIGIGITGTMGNVDYANKEASVPGKVYFAFCFRGRVYDYCKEISEQRSRLGYKLAVAKEVVDELQKVLQDVR